MPESRALTLKVAFLVHKNESAYLFALCDIVAQVAHGKILSHSKSQSRKIGDFIAQMATLHTSRELAL